MEVSSLYIEKMLSDSSGRDKALKILQNILRLIRYNIKNKDTSAFGKLSTFISIFLTYAYPKKKILEIQGNALIS